MYKIYENSNFISEWNSLREAKTMANFLYTNGLLQFEPKKIVIKKLVRRIRPSKIDRIMIYCTGTKNGKLTFSKPIKESFRV